MNIDTILHYIDLYGYFIIFVFLFFGIVGIPAPEESLLFLIGVLIAHHKFSFGWAVFYSISGAFSGMLTAYVCGKYIGHPFIDKYGKYVGITNERWEKARGKFTKNVYRTILLGFYLPGLRQINPYFAGISHIRFRGFLLFSLIGSILWTVPFILAGYYAGGIFHINPAYVPYLGVFFLVLFLLYVTFNFFLKKRKGLE